MSSRRGLLRHFQQNTTTLCTEQPTVISVMRERPKEKVDTPKPWNAPSRDERPDRPNLHKQRDHPETTHCNASAHMFHKTRY